MDLSGWFPEIVRRLGEIERRQRNQGMYQELILIKIAKILQREKQMAQELDDLTAEVAATVGVENSVAVLLNGIAAKIDALVAAGGKPEQFAALSGQLKAARETIATAAATIT